MGDGEDETDGSAGKIAGLLREADALGGMAAEDQAEALAGLLARMAAAGLAASTEEVVLKRLKAATGASMKTLRADYRRLGRGRVEKLTHHNVAEAFADSHEGVAVFCHSRGRWFVYNRRAGAWRMDSTSVVADQIRRFAQERLAGSNEADDVGEVVRLGSAAFTAGVETLAKADMRLRRVAGDFDKAPQLLGTPGGVYDLTTGGLFAGTACDALITKTTVVAPADRAGCPRFITFLDEACGGDPDLVEHVIRALGYALWGGNPEEVVVFVFGPGGNGKSVLVDLMRWLLGEYAQTASMTTFQEAQGDRGSNDVAMLAGARLVAALETRKGRTWDEQRVNALTGGDMVTARHLYGNLFSFMPQFLPVLAGNHKPALATVNEAARRRFLIWPFTVQPAVKDTELGAKLRAEGPAILRLLINECARWHTAWKRGEANRLRVPEAVMQATAEYMAAHEPVAQWVPERCEVDAKALGEQRELHADYVAWLAERERDEGESDEGSVGLKAFGRALENLGYGRKKIRGERFFGGLQLKPRN